MVFVLCSRAPLKSKVQFPNLWTFSKKFWISIAKRIHNFLLQIKVLTSQKVLWGKVKGRTEIDNEGFDDIFYHFWKFVGKYVAPPPTQPPSTSVNNPSPSSSSEPRLSTSSARGSPTISSTKTDSSTPKPTHSTENTISSTEDASEPSTSVTTFSRSSSTQATSSLAIKPTSSKPILVATSSSINVIRPSSSEFSC